ncbi:hypothetical protein MM213_08940 [Belliella sp. R4-6]|uniref:Uncharacterized protein n=1 Tax=Belliella alkalica TaxID=1730871 RepID=A0ABS9VB58_9BACT|nr:hypothetical protein [Belliella alkalica]MCH7413608.1 hypothetical protein [Belliella alkalica]
MERIIIQSIKKINWISNFWTLYDYRELLHLFEFPNPEKIRDVDLLDSIKLAISWNDPSKSAEIVLKYKFGGILKEDEIKHYIYVLLNGDDSQWGPLYITMFCVNQLLRSAYNGCLQDKRLVQIIFYHKGGVLYDKKVLFENIVKHLKSPNFQNRSNLYLNNMETIKFDLLTLESSFEEFQEYSVLSPSFVVFNTIQQA